MNIFNIFKVGANRTRGEVGIEIEFEGEWCPRAARGWRGEHDGSLRGESREYVLDQPCLRENVHDILSPMLARLNGEDAGAKNSINTSVHIHINVQELSLQQYFNFIFLYMLFEDSLVRFCGERREGNLFCLRTKDAEGLEFIIRECLENNEWNALSEDTLRYGSINLNASHRYGSLEFRAMRGTIDQAVIEQWINILLNLKDKAKSFVNPANIVTYFDEFNSVEEMVEHLMGTHSSIIFDNPTYLGDIELAMKRISCLAHLNTWVDMVCVDQPFYDI